MSTYEERQEARRQRYLDRAAKNADAGEANFERAHKMGEVIPFGQPILVGHHSEGRDRRYRGRITRVMDKGMEAVKKAEYYEDKAASVGKGGISSDDPDALDKLREKVEKLEKLQETMKAANKIVKSKKLSDTEKISQVATLEGISEDTASKLLEPDFCGRIGFPDYALTNNNANIRRIKERIEHLEAEAQRQEVAGEVREQYGEITYQESDNRVALIFPGKPNEQIRTLLKRNGFRWTPTRGAWTRMLNESGRYWAKYVIKKIEEGRL